MSIRRCIRKEKQLMEVRGGGEGTDIDEGGRRFSKREQPM